MAEIVLFHSALGLRPAVFAGAERLRAAGHVVHVPDLYAGKSADNVVDGMAINRGIGYPELLRRAAAVVDGLAGGLVHAGLSLGASLSANLARTRGDASALVMLHHAPEYVPGVPAALHAADPDEWVEADRYAAWAGKPDVETWRYPGASHLYTDPDTQESLPGDTTAAELTWQRVLEFLARLG
ncbi:dienelactone hydrolase family protein [Amycolatopsis sp. NPDC059027]|uniref:dienelactone hydrolase family protein n=1 Tax=unclassified Amycolatopsis TaxID=2618356 RepID=UPI003671EDD3